MRAKSRSLSTRTKNAEFPEEGKFKLKDDVLYTHYTVCGDADDCESTPPGADVIPPQQPGPSHPSSSFTSEWLIPRPWASVYNQAKAIGYAECL